MRDLEGRGVLLTGASRGLGRFLARRLAARGADLVLSARSEAALEEVAQEVRSVAARVQVVPADLSDREAIPRLASRATEVLDGIDVLVNNAGIVSPYPYHRTPESEIGRAVEVNLLAPMLLSRRLLPGMVRRGWGHVVNVSSLAGKAGPPYEAAYGATKAGLIGFTQSIRREYHGTGVSASVVCPGFVEEAGMYADARAETGTEAPGITGRATPDEVARAVVRAVEEDLAEVIVNSTPVRPLLALSELSPAAGEWVARALGLFRSIEAQAEERLERGGAGS